MKLSFWYSTICLNLANSLITVADDIMCIYPNLQIRKADQLFPQHQLSEVNWLVSPLSRWWLVVKLTTDGVGASSSPKGDFPRLTVIQGLL